MHPLHHDPHCTHARDGGPLDGTCSRCVGLSERHREISPTHRALLPQPERAASRSARPTVPQPRWFTVCAAAVDGAFVMLTLTVVVTLIALLGAITVVMVNAA